MARKEKKGLQVSEQKTKKTIITKHLASSV